MFKRVEKRQRKREEEEELGLDEEMKQVLGMNDTDSEESASDTDDSESDGVGIGHKGVYDSDVEESVFEQVEGEETEDEASLPVITVQEALRDPVYIISLDPSVKGCILCPGKILKGSKMIEIHRKSNAHERRARQFAAFASGVNSHTNAREILAQQEAEKNTKRPFGTPSETSKRAEKRRSRAALCKMRRNKQKAKTQAVKAAATKLSTAPTELQPASSVAEPPKKKQKSDGSTSSPPLAVKAIQSSRKKEVKSIATIARSTSDRARAARAKATKVDANQT